MRRFILGSLVLPLCAVAEPTRVTGAPLKNSEVDVHVLEQKPVRDAGRFELTVYPVVPQLNGVYTQHVGTMGQLTWHVREHFGFTLMGGGNWLNRTSNFNAELFNSAGVVGLVSLLWTWTAMAGVEVAPISGKFTLFDSGLVHFSVVINAGAGLGGTRHLLKPAGMTPATYGDTGVRFMGTVGAGFRLVLGEHVAIRLEVRDVVYTSRVDSVNGCSSADAVLWRGVWRIRPSTPTCSEASLPDSNDEALAIGLIRKRSSEVIHSLGAWAGVSFIY
ncbi:MAG: outer membrane beta-barrel domain-containing protein [Myxococcales bacterium]|nr:outer membrane beta-barrel domain-containing protein [Myxococcales bacterium]